MKNIPKSFIGFLIISTFIWLIITLSRTYVQTSSFGVVYTDLPQDKIYNTEPVNSINIEVEGTGFRFFRANFFQDDIKLSLKKLYKKNNKSYYLELKNSTKEIQKQLSSGLILKKIEEDVVYFDLGSLETKKVPIMPDLSIDYQLGFDATKVTIFPDSVLLSGTEKQLKNINNITLKPLVFKDVSEDLSTEVDVILPKKDKKVKLSHNKVKLSIKVDKFTEGEFEVPVFVKNISSDKITIYPKKVKVIFKVSLKEFNKITPNSFDVEADYEYSKDNNLSYLVPKIKSKSDFISNVRIIPQKIDFLIQK